MLRVRIAALVGLLVLGVALMGQPQPSGPTVATSFKGHNGEVYAVSYSPDGKYLVTASFDRSLRIWDALGGKEIKAFGGTGGHQNLVLAVALSPDGSVIASGSSDNTLKLWDFPTSNALRSLAHDDAVTATALSNDGAKLASAEKSGTVRLVNVADGKELFKLKGHEGIVSGLAFSTNNAVLVSCGADRTIRFWNVADGKPLTVIGAHTSAVHGVAFAVNSNSAAYSIGEDGALKFWQLPQTGSRPLSAPHGEAVTAITLTPDGATIVSASKDKTVRLSSANNGTQRLALAGSTTAIVSTAHAPQGGLVAGGTEKDVVFVWNAADGKVVQQFPAHAGAVTEVAFSADGKQLFTAGQDGLVRQWAVPANPAKSLTHPQGVNAVSLSSDGKRLISGGQDGVVRTWTLANAQAERQFTGHALAVTAVASNANDQLIASAGGDRTIRLWNAQKGDLAFLLGAHDDGVNSLMFHPTQAQLLSASTDGSVKLWNLPQAAPVQLAHSDTVTSLALTPDGGKLLTGCGDKKVRVWNLGSGQSERSLEGNTLGVLSVAVSANGAQAVAGGLDKSLTVWNLSDGKVVVRYTLPAQAQAVVFAPDGKVLAGLTDNSLRLYDPANAKETKELKTFAGHTGAVTALALSPKGDRYVSGSADKTVRLWNVADGKEAGKIEVGGPVSSLALSKDGARLAVASEKAVKVWTLADNKLAHTLAQPAEARGLAFLPDGTQLLVGAADNKARLIGLDGKLREFFSHDGEVGAVAVSADGKRVFSAGKDKSVRLWRPALAWQGQHTGTVSAAVLLPGGAQALSAGHDRKLKLWNSADGKLLFSKEAHVGAVLGLSLSSDGSRVASAGADGTVKVWSLKPADKAPLGEAPLIEIKVADKIQAAALSADGMRVSVALEEADKKPALAVFDVVSGKEMTRLRGQHTAAVSAMTYARDSRTLLTASQDKSARQIDVPVLAAYPVHGQGTTRFALRGAAPQLLSGGADKTVKLWELPSGKAIRTLAELADPIAEVQFSRDGVLAAAAAGKLVKVWNVADGKETQPLTHPGKVTSLSFLPDRTRIATASEDRWVRVWDLASGKELEAFLHDGPVQAVCYRDANTLLAGGADKNVFTHAPRLTRAVSATTDALTSLAVSANASHVLTTGADKKLRLWNAGNGNVERTIEGLAEKPGAVAVSRNVALIAVAVGSDVQLLNYADGKVLGTVKAPAAVTALSFSANNNTLAASCASGAVQTWNVAFQPGQQLPAEFGKPVQGYAHAESALCLSWTPDSTMLYSGSTDKTLKAWKFASDSATRNLQHPGIVHAVAFNHDGSQVASGCQDGQLRTYDVAKGTSLKTIQAHTRPAPEPIYCVAWSPDGKQIVTGSNDGSLKLWDAAGGTQVREFRAYKEKEFEQGHREAVYCVAFSPDGKTIASGSSDRTIKFWNVADGKVQRELVNPKLTGDPKPSHPGYVYGVRFSKDGKYLFSVGRAPGKGAVQVWTAGDGKLLSADELDVGPIFGLALAPDGKSLAVATGPRGRPGSPEAEQSPLTYILTLPKLP